METMLTEWEKDYDLTDCTFSFKGRKVSGEKLALLLGLVEPSAEKYADELAAFDRAAKKILDNPSSPCSKSTLTEPPA